MTPKRHPFTFGDPGTPETPLVACPSCLHVAAARVLSRGRYECKWCKSVVRVVTEGKP